MKNATAYMWNERIFLHASSKTTAGFFILTDPVMSVGIENTTRIGKCVVEALEGSIEGANSPSSWQGLFDPILRLAEVNNFGTFMKSAKCVEIELLSDHVRFIPTKNLGVDDGFEPLELQTQVVLSKSDDDIGSALLSAFNNAE